MAIKPRTPEPRPKPPRLTARRQRVRDPAGAGRADIKRDPTAPTVGVHWAIVAIALAAAAWFVVAAVTLFSGSGSAGNDYVLWIVAGFAIVFFGLTLGLARRAADDPRYGGPGSRVSLRDAIHDNVAIFTGVIAGREAMVQLLTLPVVLAIGATLIGIVFVWVS